MRNKPTVPEAPERQVKRHKAYIPGKVIVRWKQDVVRGAARSTAAHAGPHAVLPERVQQRLEFLRTNHGLREVRELASAGRGRMERRAAARATDSIARSMAADRGGLRGVTVLEFDPAAKTAEIARHLQGDEVVYAQPAPARWLAASSPRDPRYGSQWGLPAIEWFRARRPRSTSIKVAVLDSGVDRSHPDLASAVASYERMGFSATDLIGHGTHVAGIIAAAVNNDIGIAGVANCKLACWKVFSDTPEDDGEIYMDNEAYYKALAAAAATPGVRVVNLSLGGVARDDTEASVMKTLTGRDDLLVVAAMGNEYEAGNPRSYPAALPGVLAVGAIAPNRRRATFSNTGRHIALVAPGESVLSTVPRRRSKYRDEVDYVAWDGTSMAAPFVAGAAALVWARRPALSAGEVRERLCGNTTPLPAMRKKSHTSAYGSGLLNLHAALG